MKIKNKKLPIILGCLGVVALTSIGFATWLIGYEDKVKNNGVTVSVDTFEDKGCILECIPAASDGKINLGDFATENPGGSKKPVKVETATADLTVELDSFKLAISNEYKTKPTKIKFDVKLDQVALSTVTHTVEADDPFERTQGEKTFLDFGHSQEISLSSITNPDTTSIPGWTVYDFKTHSGFGEGFKFSYGGLYKKESDTTGQVSPAIFYNANTPDYNPNATIKSQKGTLAKWSLASEELVALNSAFSGGKNIKITITAE